MYKLQHSEWCFIEECKQRVINNMTKEVVLVIAKHFMHFFALQFHLQTVKPVGPTGLIRTVSYEAAKELN